MIAANTDSSSMFANPPPCGRTRAGGSNGLANSHKPSGTIHPHRPLPMPNTTANRPCRTRSKEQFLSAITIYRMNGGGVRAYQLRYEASSLSHF